MPQFLRPSTDTTREAWETEAGGTTNIFQQIDESVANDADFIRSAVAPTNDVYATKLTAGEDPLSSTGHTVRWRYNKSASGGAQINLTVELRQGYTNEGAQGTLIATVATLTNISDTVTAGSYTLSGGEADAITDYSDLYLRYVANQV